MTVYQFQLIGEALGKKRKLRMGDFLQSTTIAIGTAFSRNPRKELDKIGKWLSEDN